MILIFAEVKVSYQGPNLSDEPNTKILQLNSITPRPSTSTGLKPSSPRAGVINDTISITMGRETLSISITPPVLPLCFANALLTLYAVHEPGVDCKLPLLGDV